MAYGIKLNNSLETHLNSSYSMPVLAAYGEVAYNQAATSDGNASCCTINVPMTKAFPVKLWERVGTSNIYTKASPGVQIYRATTSGDVCTIKAASEPYIWGVELDSTGEPSASSNFNVKAYIGGKSVTSTQLSGKLYIAIFVEMPANPSIGQWGLRLNDSSGNCKFSSQYEPMMYESVSDIPGFNKDKVDQWDYRIAIPGFQQGQLYMTADFGRASALGYFRYPSKKCTDYEFGITTTPDGFIYKNVFRYVTYSTVFGVATSSDFISSGFSKIFIIKVSDYFKL